MHSCESQSAGLTGAGIADRGELPEVVLASESVRDVCGLYVNGTQLWIRDFSIHRSWLSLGEGTELEPISSVHTEGKLYSSIPFFLVTLQKYHFE